jgi:hypothetical protein
MVTSGAGVSLRALLGGNTGFPLAMIGELYNAIRELCNDRLPARRYYERTVNGSD